MRRLARVSALLPFALIWSAPGFAAAPAPVAQLVKAVDIPFEQFTLLNGLRVIVHTDRKAPVVAVSVWYHVGSKDEPSGKTGFAHLFEHLMYNGSENANFDFFKPMQQAGATDMNGTTSFDRTNYFETVPTGALEQTLFLESDRMGHLLGGIDQEKLDVQRGVVQNEKRQGDNEPFGLAEYTISTTLFPAGHPYHHSTIGSMADLNDASLGDVKDWFRAKYGAGNAVLVLAGDIDVPKAKTLVTRYFGDIARGPAVTRVNAPVPTLPAPVSKTLKDAVPYTRLMRTWAVEGVNGKDTTNLDVAVAVLGGLSSSRLDNALVRRDKSAVSVTAYLQAFENVGQVTVSVDVKPGQDPLIVGKKLDAIIADFLKHGPTADEVRRVVTRSVSGTIGGFESVGGFGGKAVALAEGLVYSGDPAEYKKELVKLAAVTPASAHAAARKWLSRPVFNLTIEPGERDSSDAAKAITGDLTGAAPVAVPTPVAATSTATLNKRETPPVGELAKLAFPKTERTVLSNGIPVFFARRPSVPVVRVSVAFDAGFTADPREGLGTQALMMSLLDEGTTTRTSTKIAEDSERLGANISAGGGVDRSSVGLYALTPNLGASLGLLADIVRNPAFDAKEVERLRGQQLAGLAAQLTDPQSIARYVMPGLIFGKDYPYGMPGGGVGTPASLRKISRQSLVDFHRNWIRPDTAQIFVVGDTTLAALTPLLEQSFGTWKAPASPKPVKNFAAAIPTPTSKIYLIDRPQSPQSVIRGGLVLNATGKDEVLALRQADDILGGAFLSRFNTDIRETKHWSYGVSSAVSSSEQRLSYVINAPVQADKTGASLTALLDNTKAFLGPKGVTSEELERTISGSIRELPGNFETSDAVLAAIQKNVWLSRPDDYYEKIADRYRSLTAAQLDAAARAALDPAKLTFVVVGDAKIVRPQLDAVGIPVETLPPPTAK